MSAIAPATTALGKLSRLLAIIRSSTGGEAAKPVPVVPARPQGVFEAIMNVLPDAGIHVGEFRGKRYAWGCLERNYYNVCLSGKTLNRLEFDERFREDVLAALRRGAEETYGRLPGMYVAARGFVVEESGVVRSWSIDLPEPERPETDRVFTRRIIAESKRKRRAADIAPSRNSACSERK